MPWKISGKRSGWSQKPLPATAATAPSPCISAAAFEPAELQQVPSLPRRVGAVELVDAEFGAMWVLVMSVSRRRSAVGRPFISRPLPDDGDS